MIVGVWKHVTRDGSLYKYLASNTLPISYFLTLFETSYKASWTLGLIWYGSSSVIHPLLQPQYCENCSLRTKSSINVKEISCSFRVCQVQSMPTSPLGLAWRRGARIVAEAAEVPHAKVLHLPGWCWKSRPMPCSQTHCDWVPSGKAPSKSIPGARQAALPPCCVSYLPLSPPCRAGGWNGGSKAGKPGS